MTTEQVMKLTEQQRQGLRSLRNQLSADHETLKTLMAKRDEFKSALPLVQKLVQDLKAPTLDNSEILKLIVAERKLSNIFSFLGQIGPDITKQECEIMHRLQRFREQLYAEIYPDVFHCLERDLPLWAANGAPALQRAKAAIVEIDELLKSLAKE